MFNPAYRSKPRFAIQVAINILCSPSQTFFNVDLAQKRFRRYSAIAATKLNRLHFIVIRLTKILFHFSKFLAGGNVTVEFLGDIRTIALSPALVDDLSRQPGKWRSILVWLYRSIHLRTN